MPVSIDVIAAVRELELDPESYVVVGSGVLAALRLIDDPYDVDMSVSQPVYDRFKASGWQEITIGDKNLLRDGVYDLGVGIGNWALRDLQADAIIIDDVPFMSLSKLRTYKAHRQNRKDQLHLPLIDAYVH